MKGYASATNSAVRTGNRHKIPVRKVRMRRIKLSPQARVATVAAVALAGAFANALTPACAGTTKAAAKKVADPCAYPASEGALLSCRRREYDKAEADIAKLVAVLAKNYATEVALAGVFSASQFKWREFRDAECKLKTYDSQGGTAYESFWLECLTKLDQDRIKTLEDLRDHP